MALSLLTRGWFLGVDLIDIDEASYTVGSWELLRGRLLYTNFADHKPPLVYVYYALAQLLFGRGMLAVRLLTTLVTVPLTAYAASAFFRHDRRGVVAGCLYLVYGAAFWGHDMQAVNCELLLLLPATWALVLVRDAEDVSRPWRMAGAGLLLGAALLIKHQAVFWLAAVAGAATYELWRRDRGRFAGLAALGVGFALPPVLACGYFAARGGADAFLYWNVTHNLFYAANPILVSEAFRNFLLVVAPFFLVTIFLWSAWVRSLPAFSSRYQAALISALIVVSAAQAFLGFRFYPHYFILLYVPLALGAAPLMADLTRRPIGPSGRRVLGYTLFWLVAFTLASSARFLGWWPGHEERDPVFRDVATRLREDECFTNASLFVWGYAPAFYYYADRPIAARFVFPESTLVGYVSGNRGSGSGDVETSHLIRPEHWDWLMQDLERNNPAYVLDTAPAGIHRWRRFPISEYPRLSAFVRERYEPMADVAGVVIYKRKGCGTVNR